MATVRLYIAVICCLAAGLATARPDAIVIGDASPMEEYAARELQRYLAAISGRTFPIVRDTTNTAAFAIGRPESNPLLRELNVSVNELKTNGYLLKTLGNERGRFLAIAARDESGCLNGVYGLLQDHYDVVFSFSGDILPEPRRPFRIPEVKEGKNPLLKIRGLLPWTNFPQSPSSYSWEDWRYVIDQMARMRFNLLFIHNYSGEHGHNEMFANFTLDGVTSRVAMPTARSGHGWHGPGWEPAGYRFGAADLFDDYDFGADCALHNEGLDNAAVSRKGVTLFQRVLTHAHRRGVRVALGLDVDMIPEVYGKVASDPRVIEARVAQLATDYPDLDYLVCFQSENVIKSPTFQQEWAGIIRGFDSALKRKATRTRLAVSGWGLDPEAVRSLPRDVIVAPISTYSDEFESGNKYAPREYWAGPWLERDQVSSQYYYPYNIHLWNSMNSFRRRAENMTGMFALTWRLTDAVEPKIWWASRAGWEGDLNRSRQLYVRWAQLAYGKESAEELGAILDGNEPFASDFAECQGTPSFGGMGNSRRERAKAERQVAVIERMLRSPTTTSSQKRRLQALYCRIAAVRDHILLNECFDRQDWASTPQLFKSWVDNFTRRVTDISSLGNVVSIQNRFIQFRYLPIEKRYPALAPSKPHPQLIVISPPTSSVVGERCSVKALILDAPDGVAPQLHYRALGETTWTTVMMDRRVRACFSAELPSSHAGTLEYRITAGALSYPSADENLAVIVASLPGDPPRSPVSAEGADVLKWEPPSRPPHTYAVYRSRQPACPVGAATFLTYLPGHLTEFRDLAEDFDGQPLSGFYYYRITSRDLHGRESTPTLPVTIAYLRKQS